MQLKRSEKNLHKTFQLHSAASAIYLKADEVKLLQAVGNLLSNSLKFTPDGGLITVTIQEEAQQVRIQVQDNGIGIPQSLLPILFDQFTKAKRPGIRGEKPIGLGLSITKQVIELHGGRVEVESQENKGTTVSITLPKE